MKKALVLCDLTFFPLSHALALARVLKRAFHDELDELLHGEVFEALCMTQ